MSDDFDPNKVAAEFIQSNLDAIYQSAKGFLKGAKDSVMLLLENTYRAYATDLLSKYGKTKTFFIRGEPTSIYEFYVPLDLKISKERIQGPGISEIINKCRNVIVTGSAGCGKSMLFRHLLINCLESRMRIPIFVELRQFNSFEGDLFDLIIKTMHLFKFKLDREYVKKALLKGHFVIFLDGYDEVIISKRTDVRNWIYDFTRRFDNNYVLMSSRPDNEIEGWQLFTMADVCPLSLQQASTLVGKLPFDEQIRAKFLSELESDLFVKHESFLSNPLLLSIMLLSYGQSATIPNKLSIFYNQAYEALFERHDALKDGFKREIQSGLDIQDFSRLFSAFSIQTYDKRVFEFSHSEALEFVRSSQRILSVDCDKDRYLSDLIQATCLLVQDGLLLTYAHRSFQEFFAAKFICEMKPKVQQQLVEKYSRYFEADNMLSMLFEMRPEVVEEYLLLPWLDEIYNLFGACNEISNDHYARFIDNCMFGLDMSEERGLVYICKPEGANFLNKLFFVRSRYRNIIPEIHFARLMLDKQYNQDRIIKKYNLDCDERKKLDAEMLADLVELQIPATQDEIRALLSLRDFLIEKAKIGGETLEAILTS